MIAALIDSISITLGGFSALYEVCIGAAFAVEVDGSTAVTLASGGYDIEQHGSPLMPIHGSVCVGRLFGLRTVVSTIILLSSEVYRESFLNEIQIHIILNDISNYFLYSKTFQPPIYIIR